MSAANRLNATFLRMTKPPLLRIAFLLQSSNLLSSSRGLEERRERLGSSSVQAGRSEIMSMAKDLIPWEDRISRRQDLSFEEARCICTNRGLPFSLANVVGYGCFVRIVRALFSGSAERSRATSSGGEKRLPVPRPHAATARRHRVTHFAPMRLHPYARVRCSFSMP